MEDDEHWRDEAMWTSMVLGGTAIAISGRLLLQHVRVIASLPAGTAKRAQAEHTVRILLMVPIYALASVASLVWVDSAPLIDLCRDAYEAYVIFAFLSLALSLGGHEDGVVETLARERGSHSFPLSLVLSSPFPYTPSTILTIERAVLQYTLVRPAMALLCVVASWLDLYEEGIWGWTSLWTWTTIVNNLSVTVAMYGLLYLYFGLRGPLHHLGLTPKLLCIKALLAVAFYQSIVIAGLAHYGLIPHGATYTVEKIETGIQDLLMVAEMVLAALADRIAYPVPRRVRGKKGAGSKAKSTTLLASFWSVFGSGFLFTAVYDVFVEGSGVCKGIPHARKIYPTLDITPSTSSSHHSV